MQRKRIVNSLLIVVGVAFGSNFSAGKVSAAEISVDDVVPVTIVDQPSTGNVPEEVDEEAFSDETFPEEDEWLIEELLDEETLGDEWSSEEEPIDEMAIDERVDVEIGEAIAIERSADGTVTVPDLLAPEEGAWEGDGATEVVASQLDREFDVSTPSSLPAAQGAASSEHSEVAGVETVDAADLRPIVQRGEPTSELNRAVAFALLALTMIAAGLIAHWNRLLNLGSRV